MNTNNKINGWLYLPAAGLIIASITGTINYFNIARLFLLKFINNLPISYTFAIFIVIGGGLYLASLYFAMFCFFKQRKKTRNAMITYYVYSFILNGSVIWFSWLHLGIDPTPKEIGLLISICVGFFIWVPYFILSKRIPIVFYK